jgi:hypothetical protein
MAPEFVAALREQKFTDAAKLVDVAFASCQASDKQTLASLLVNRGFCQQKLQLYRKALKVYVACGVDRKLGILEHHQFPSHRTMTLRCNQYLVSQLLCTAKVRF